MNPLLIILVLLLLFGGGGFYLGGPAIGGGGFGLILLVCIVIYFMGGFRTKRVGPHDRAAAGIKGRESAGVVVAGPAVEIVPAGRLQCGIGDFQRPGAAISGRGMRCSPIRKLLRERSVCAPQ